MNTRFEEYCRNNATTTGAEQRLRNRIARVHCSSQSACSAFAKAYPCDEEGAIECSDCRHTHHCDMEDRRDDIRDAFLAGMDYTPNARLDRQEEVAAQCDCSALRLIDWEAVDNESHRNAWIQQLPRFEVRRGEEVLSQGATEVQAWQRCAEFLAQNAEHHARPERSERT